MALDLREVSIENLCYLDGGVAVEQIRRLLTEANRDIQSRPGVGGARTLKITLKLTPKVHKDVDNDTGRTETHLLGVGLDIHFDLKKPERKTLTYDLGVSGDKLLFNRNSPYDHRQHTLPGMVDGQATPAES